MQAIRKTAQVTRDCVACGTCVKHCPRGAILVYRGMYAKVEESHCVGCGLCVKACPAGTIRIVAKGETK